MKWKWLLYENSVYVLKCEDFAPTSKLAMFDLDGTWIRTASGKKHAQSVDDWLFLDQKESVCEPSVICSKLEQLHKDKYSVVLVSNQFGITKGVLKPEELLQKMLYILTHLKIPILGLFPFQRDGYRKPFLGCWELLLEQFDEMPCEAFYVGDAAGRRYSASKADFASVDVNFAKNIQLYGTYFPNTVSNLEFYTPEQFFGLKQTRPTASFFDKSLQPVSEWKKQQLEPTTFVPSATQEIVVLVGCPASGKSTFAKHFVKQYAVVNQDQLKTLKKCEEVASEALQKGQSVLIDNTNRNKKTRQTWIAMAEQYQVPIRCVWFRVSKPLAFVLDAMRVALHKERLCLPAVAFHRFFAEFEEPKEFKDVVSFFFQPLLNTKQEILAWETKFEL